MNEITSSEIPLDKQQRRVSIWLVLVVLTISTLWAYRTSFRGQFVLDDRPHIVENPSIRTMPSLTEVIQQQSRPLVHWSLAMNFRLGGLNPYGYHLFNLTVHFSAGLFLFGVVRRTLRLEGIPDRLVSASDGLALAVAWLWLVHPLQTNAVTYTIQRGESMMALCYLICLYSMVRGSQSRWSWTWYLIAIFACAAGFKCKEVMISAPLVILIYDRIFLSRSWIALLRRRWWVYLGLAVPTVMTAVRFLGSAPPPGRATAGFSVQSISPLEYLCTQAGVLVHYLRLSIWPDPLCLDYQWPTATTWQAIVPAGLVIVGLLIGTVIGLWKRPRVAFLGVAFFFILAPTSSFVPIEDAAFEHRMYLPLAAVLMLLVLAIHQLLTRLVSDGTQRRTISMLVLLLVAAWWTIWTADRNRDYSDGLRMWTNIVQAAPHNYRAHLNRGIELEIRGRIDEAKQEFDQVLELNPQYDRGHMNIARWYASQDKTDLAISHYQEAIRLRPTYYKAYTNLGNVYARQGDLEQAERYFRKTLELNSRYAPAYLSLGQALWGQERWSEAIAAAGEAYHLMPDQPTLRLRLAWMLATVPDDRLRNGRQAMRLVQPLIEYTGPIGYQALDTFAAALAAQESFVEAAQYASRAIAAARQADDEKFADLVKLRLQQYEAGQMYIDRGAN